MTRSTFSRLLVCLSAVSLASCQEYDAGFSESQIKEAVYARNFVKTFGNIDPNQDWNLVAQLASSRGKSATRSGYSGGSYSIGSVSVETLPESQACPLTTAQMLDYKKMLPEIGSTKTNKSETNLGRVTQDFTARVKEIVLYPIYWWTDASDIVGIYYRVPAGTPGAEAVSHTTTQGVTTNVTDEEGNQVYIVKVPITVGRPEELEYSKNGKKVIGYMNSLNDMPADIWAAICQSHSEYKTADGTSAFVNENGWAFNNGTKLIYAGTKDGNDYYREVSFYSDDDWNALVAASNGKLLTTTGAETDSWNNTISSGLKAYLIAEGGVQWRSVLSWLNTLGNNIKVDPIIENANSGSTEITGFRSKGIKVTLPETTEIGFYIENSGAVMYSDSKLNYKVQFTDPAEEVNACHIATYESTETDRNGDKIRYLGFEDWKWTSDFDLNDIMFRVYGLDEHSIIDNEETTEEGLLVCEDLGDFDFDFNDVVLKLKWNQHVKKEYTIDADGYVTGVTILGDEQTFSITGMAAGGAIESTVKYKGAEVGGIHALLSGQAPDILNAGSTFAGEGKTKTYTLNDSDWDKSKYPTGYVSQVFGEGLVTIHVENGTDAEKIITSTKYREHGAPQMMLLPVSFEWPQELQTIGTVDGQTGVYPDFDKWVENASFNVWINNHDDRVTKR